MPFILTRNSMDASHVFGFYWSYQAMMFGLRRIFKPTPSRICPTCSIYRPMYIRGVYPSSGLDLLPISSSRTMNLEPTMYLCSTYQAHRVLVWMRVYVCFDVFLFCFVSLPSVLWIVEKYEVRLLEEVTPVFSFMHRWLFPIKFKSKGFMFFFFFGLLFVIFYPFCGHLLSLFRCF